VTPALQLAGVTVWRPDGTRRQVLLDGIDWTVEPGEHWVVLGPNGAGKSTMLNVAGAVDHPSEGTVDVLGRRLGRTDLRALRERIGMVDARVARGLRGAMPAHAVVLTGLFGAVALQRHRITEEHRAHAHELLELVGAAQLADRTYERCSQGERQRILLARALIGRPDLLLLDEPTSGLDLPSRERLIEAMVATARARPGLPTVTVTHHLEEIPPSTTHALLLAEGRVCAAGEIEDTLTSANVSRTFGLDVDVARPNGRWTAGLRTPPSGSQALL